MSPRSLAAGWGPPLSSGGSVRGALRNDEIVANELKPLGQGRVLLEPARERRRSSAEVDVVDAQVAVFLPGTELTQFVEHWNGIDH